MLEKETLRWDWACLAEAGMKYHSVHPQVDFCSQHCNSPSPPDPRGDERHLAMNLYNRATCTFSTRPLSAREIFCMTQVLVYKIGVHNKYLLIVNNTLFQNNFGIQLNYHLLNKAILCF